MCRSRRGRRARRAFTLLEAAAVCLVIGIVTVVAGFAYTRIGTSQSDLAGAPVLGAAQAQARRVAAVDHYAWDFAAGRPSADAALVSALSAGSADAAAGGLDFVAGPSTGPRVVSAAWGDATHVGFAVLTSPGHCLLMLDSLTGGTHWARDTAAADGGCAAGAAAGTLASCPTVISGSALAPSAFSVADPCTRPAGATG